MVNIFNKIFYLEYEDRVFQYQEKGNTKIINKKIIGYDTSSSNEIGVRKCLNISKLF